MVRKAAKKPKPARPKRERLTVASMVERVAGSPWSTRILGLLAEGCSDPDAIREECPGLTVKEMDEQLRTMIGFGLAVQADRDAKPRSRGEYMLTPLGHGFMRLRAELERLQEAMDGAAPAARRGRRD
jgi:DNA-binding HxlR family transcriptional regulator